MDVSCRAIRVRLEREEATESAKVAHKQKIHGPGLVLGLLGMQIPAGKGLKSHLI